jgi:hypothetical protein
MSPHRIPQALQQYPTLAAALSKVVEFAARLGDASPLAWLVAALSPLLAAAGQDPFTWAWVLLCVFSAGDHAIGVRRARDLGTYQKAEAARGRREKFNTILLMLGFRALEGYATGYGMLNVAGLLKLLHLDDVAQSPVVQQGGIVSAVITILLAFGELRSVYVQRVADGGSRILLAELAFNGVRAAERFVLGRAAKAVEGWAGEDAGALFQRNLEGIRQIDDGCYRRTHDGDAAPARRHYDRAVEELRTADGGQAPAGGLDDT